MYWLPLFSHIQTLPATSLELKVALAEFHFTSLIDIGRPDPIIVQTTPATLGKSPYNGWE